MMGPVEKRVTISDGIFSINLGAPGDTGYGDGEWRNIRCNIVSLGGTARKRATANSL